MDILLYRELCNNIVRFCYINNQADEVIMPAKFAASQSIVLVTGMYTRCFTGHITVKQLKHFWLVDFVNTEFF